MLMIDLMKKIYWMAIFVFLMAFFTGNAYANDDKKSNDEHAEKVIEHYLMKIKRELEKSPPAPQIQPVTNRAI